MSANVETMFSVRETPWHGLGRIVIDAPASREALELAGLDWQVESHNIYSGTGAMIPGYRANVRSTDEAVLGVVSDRYRIVQNEEAFRFTDDLLGEGVTYETAGSLQGGKKVWMLARLPRKYLIAGDQVVPYLVIFNSHDGSSGVKVAMTPIRVVCQNTLNLALNTAKRSWTARHTENLADAAFVSVGLCGVDQAIAQLYRLANGFRRLGIVDEPGAQSQLGNLNSVCQRVGLIQDHRSTPRPRYPLPCGKPPTPWASRSRRPHGSRPPRFLLL